MEGPGKADGTFDTPGLQCKNSTSGKPRFQQNLLELKGDAVQASSVTRTPIAVSYAPSKVSQIRRPEKHKSSKIDRRNSCCTISNHTLDTTFSCSGVVLSMTRCHCTHITGFLIETKAQRPCDCTKKLHNRSQRIFDRTSTQAKA